MKLKYWILVGFVLGLFLTEVHSEENKASTLDQIKASVNVEEPNNRVTVWIKNEWEDIKAYQRKNWADGKDQLARLPNDLKAVPGNLVNGVKQIGQDVGNLVQKISGNNNAGSDKK